MGPTLDALEAVFAPRAAAVVGASAEREKLGGRPVWMSLKGGYAGALYPVNPRAAEVHGLKAYPDFGALPGPVDLAVLALPAAAVAAQVEAAARAGARAAIVFSSDFAETGAEGAAAQAELVARAAAAGIRLLGPNCMGAFDVATGFYPTFLQAFDHRGGTGWPERGPVGVVSQSGALGAHLFVMLRDRGIGLSRFVTTGNQADLDVADAVANLAAHEGTRVIAVYMEGVRDGRRLLRALSLARAAGKPVIVLKVGSSPAGADAMRSHTASLAGDDAVHSALLREVGAHRAASLTELVDVVSVLAAGPLPPSPDVTVISLSGGGGVILADACHAHGLRLPAMPEAAQTAMRRIVPFCAPANPVDPGAPAMTDIRVTLGFLRIAMEAGASTILLFLTHLGHVERMMGPLRAGLAELRAELPGRTVAIILLGPSELGRDLRGLGFLVFDEPLAAVNALAAARAWGRTSVGTALDHPAAAAPAPLPEGQGEAAARALLRRIGVPVVPEHVVSRPEEAAQAAASYATPVAMKLDAPGLLHKTEAGAVVLDVTPERAADTFTSLAALAPAGASFSVLVSPMVRGGVELVLGARRDAVFGPLVVAGLGGIHAEIFADTAIRTAPVTPAVALDMLRALRGAPLLEGARGRPRVDLVVAAEALARLSAWMAAAPEPVLGLEINPFLALPEGEGGMALDAALERSP